MLSANRPNRTLVSGGKDRLNMFNVLPFDILCSIYSDLSCSDCLESMAVCRLWYDRVPQSTTQHWRDVVIDQLKGALEHKRFVRCLGSHVQRVVLAYEFYERELYDVLLGLITKAGCDQIKSLELQNCEILNQVLFIRALRPICTHLEEFVISNHRYSFPLSDVVAICPKLSHLSFSADSMDVYCSWNASHLFLNMTHLSLQVAMERLEPILHCCPNLISLSVTMDRSYALLRRTYTVSLDTILQICPRIQYIEFGCDKGFFDALPHGTGLQAFRSHEVDLQAPELILSTLMKHQHHLKSLSLQPTQLRHGYSLFADWSGLSSFCSSTLRELSLFGIICRGDDLATMIRQCTALEEVALTQVTLTEAVFDALCSLPSLHSLDIRRVLPRDNSAYCRFLASMNARPHHLKTLHVWVADGNVLSSVASIASLTRIVLDVSPLGISEASMLVFACELRRNTTIQALEIIGGIALLSEAVLSAFAELDHLESVHMVECIGVNSTGIQKLVDNAKRLRYLAVIRCRPVGSTTNCIHYAMEKLGSDNVNYLPPEEIDFTAL